MTQTELISVIIPSYNRPDSTVKSIESALDQTYENFEVIVVDDGSKDDTWQAINSISSEKLTAIRHETNRGGNAARNTGINHSEGEYIAFLDSDDTWKPTKLTKQLNYIRSTDFDAVYCGFERAMNSHTEKFKNEIKNRVLDSNSTEKTPPEDSTDGGSKPEGGAELIPLVLGKKFSLGGSSTLFIEREFLEDIGMWDENLQRHQDWDLLIRILKSGTIGYVNEPLLIKYDTGVPDYDSIFREKKKYLEKYSEDIVRAELNGTSIIGEHHFGLTWHALENGNWKKAIEHLRLSGVRDPVRVFDLGNPLVTGLTKSR